MPNHTDSRTWHYPNQTSMFPLNNMTVNVPKGTKYEINVYNFFRFLVCSNILCFPSIIYIHKQDRSYKVL